MCSHRRGLSALLVPGGARAAAPLTDLRSRGYSVTFAPQRMEVAGGDILLDDSWKMDKGAPGAAEIALRTLVRDAAEFHRLRPVPGEGPEVIGLRAAPRLAE